MTMMKRRNIIMVIMTSLLLGSCSSEDILSVPNGNGRIRFDVGVSQSQEVMEMPISTSPMTCGNDTLYAHSAALRNIELHNDVTSKTRGKEVDNSSFPNNFGLYGYIYNSDQSWENNGSELQPTIKEEITKDNTWTSSTYLPGKTKNMALFAYAPYINAGIPVNAGISVADGKGAPQLTYTIDSDVSKQVDLLVAKSFDVVGNTSSVELDFNHALTAVKFSVGTITGFTKINKIVISGVKNKGTLSLYGDNWSLSESTASYTIEKEIDLSTPGNITGSSNDLMLLMPQTLPSGAKLEVTMTNDIGTKTFSTDLTGDWKKGYTVTYLLSVDRVAGEFHFEVTPSTTSIPKEGGDIELKVKSYYQIADGGAQVPIPWSGTYNMGSNQYTLSGDGSVNDDIRKISVPANNSTLTHTETLRANQSKGTAQNPWNLSNSQGKAKVENTANCYVVNSKGIYSIPLVYGCAIKNGEDNDKSYNKSTFVNHEGTPISSPYIYKMVNNIDGAKLIWQDVQNMVNVIGLSSDKHSLIFEIGNNIAQGNAVVAATADGTVVWSWHIWVTDRDVSVTAAVPTKAIDTSYTYNFMPVPLGWCDGTTSTVLPRNFTLSLTQEQSGKNLLASIAQAGNTATSGNFTYYQWGRKDPFVGSTGTNSNTCKTWYDGNGTQQSNLKTSNVTTTRNKVYGITNPEYFIYGTSQWDTGATTYDDWNANLESTTAPTSPFNYTEVEKTVYDPSPVGYKLPPTNAFTGFGKTLGNGVTPNGSSFSDGGWNFYTGGLSQGPTDFWIAGGYRSYNGGSLSTVGSYGGYWSAGPGSDADGCDLGFGSSDVYPQDNVSRAIGFSVRPVSE